MSSSSIFPATSRRGVLKGILASAAASAPIAAQAKTLTDEEQLDYCLAQLRVILARMHPMVSTHHPYHFASRQDGSYRISIQGDVEFQPYQGDGVYLVSIDGWPCEYLVREEPMITLSGKHLGWSRYYGRARAEDGGWDDFERMLSPNFVRKLEDVL